MDGLGLRGKIWPVVVMATIACGAWLLVRSIASAEPIGSLSTGLSADKLPLDGSGTFVWAAGAAGPFGTPPYKSYSVGVEEGLGIDPNAIAAFVDATLADKRSWSGGGTYGMKRVASGGIRLVIATPKTVDKLCAPLNTEGQVSCARNRYIAINLLRWETAVEHWTDSLELYRRYVVNHEMGHYLRGSRHTKCPGPGKLAPIMMTQTYGLEGCLPNGWVYP